MVSNNDLLVSFIVPVYNSERYLRRCLDSILVQTYTNYEIVCIDDGSSDDSPAILDDYARQYPEKFVVKHQSNSGIAGARNEGLRLASGGYLSFVDNDDWIDSDYLSTLMGYIDSDNPADVICSGYRRPDSNGKIVVECILDEEGEWSRYLVGAPWAKVYRTRFIQSLNLNFFDTNIGEDLPFVVPALCSAKKCIVTNYCGYNWFYNTNSVSNTIHKKSEGLQFEETLDFLYSRIDAIGMTADPCAIRYFIRQVGWYLFYTRKGDGLRTTLANAARYEAWLDLRLPSWRSCSLASPSLPSGDTPATRIVVWLLAKHPLMFRFVLAVYLL